MPSLLVPCSWRSVGVSQSAHSARLQTSGTPPTSRYRDNNSPGSSCTYIRSSGTRHIFIINGLSLSRIRIGKSIRYGTDTVFNKYLLNILDIQILSTVKIIILKKRILIQKWQKKNETCETKNIWKAFELINTDTGNHIIARIWKTVGTVYDSCISFCISTTVVGMAQCTQALIWFKKDTGRLRYDVAKSFSIFRILNNCCSRHVKVK
jgi:hypothetical protein